MANVESMNSTPSAERTHIGFYGMRNAGKSSVVNAILGQPLSIVSNVKGTTTDPVLKAMELLPLGPVMIIDTPGLDDEGELGKLRISKAKEVLEKAVENFDGTVIFVSHDRYMMEQVANKYYQVKKGMLVPVDSVEPFYKEVMAKKDIMFYETSQIKGR